MSRREGGHGGGREKRVARGRDREKEVGHKGVHRGGNEYSAEEMEEYKGRLRRRQRRAIFPDVRGQSRRECEYSKEQDLSGSSAEQERYNRKSPDLSYLKAKLEPQCIETEKRWDRRQRQREKENDIRQRER